MMKKQFVNIAACFILSRKKRHAFRNKFFPKIIEVINEKKVKTYCAKVIQNAYDLSAAKAAKEAVVFIEIEPYRMCGGQMSLFSYCKYSKQVLGKDVPVLMTTMPGEYTYAHNDWFENDINICRWEQIMEILQNKEKVILHIPECDILNPETGEEMFKNRLTEEDKEVLKKIPDLQINIVNQQIEKMPDKSKFDFLFYLTKRVTQTVCHHKCATQEICNHYQIPLHFLSVWYDLGNKDPILLEQKEDLILISPDLPLNDLRLKVNIIRKIKNEFPNYEVSVIHGLSFKEYMAITSVAKAVITCGEGFDGYFNNSPQAGTMGYAVYNETFFPDRTWLNFPNVYASYDDLIAHICEDMKKDFSDKARYEDIVRKHTIEIEKLYKFDDFLDGLRRFYDNEFDFYPNKQEV